MKTLRNLIHLAGGTASAAVLNALVLVIMARMLGPAMLGIYAMVESYGTLIDQVVRLETWQPLIRYGAQAREENKPERLLALVKLGIITDFAGAAAAATIAWLGVPIAAAMLGWSAQTANYAHWYCLAVLAGISSTPVGILRLFDRFGQFAWLEPASALVRLVAVGIAFWLESSLWHLLLIMIAVLWAYRIALGTLAWRELRRQGFAQPMSASLTELKGLTRGYWRLTLTTNAAALVRKSTQELDILVVGGVAGPAIAGIYNLVRRITTVAMKGGTMVQQVAFPDLNRLWAKRDFAGFKLLILQVEIMSATAGVLLVILIATRGQWIVEMLAGPRFAAAAIPLLVQSVAACLFLSGSALRPALITMGSETQLLWIVLLSAGLFYLTLFLAVPPLGAIGASAAHIVFNITLLPFGAAAFAKALRRSRRTKADAPEHCSALDRD